MQRYNLICYKHTVLIATIATLYCIAPSPRTPCLTVCDDTGNVQEYYGYMYDRRMIELIHRNITSLDHRLPTYIPHRYTPDRYSSASEIDHALSTIVSEIRNNKVNNVRYIGTCIKDDNFDYTSGTGMLIMRLHHHPFVIKLFISSCDTITKSHGYEPYFFMRMNGGVNRHISGLTRITTNYELTQFLEHHKTLYPHITTPRVWSWIPSDTQTLYITLHDNGIYHHAQVPAVYALINDDIIQDDDTLPPQSMIFQLFQDTRNLFDPHKGNCVTDAFTRDYVILDTEYFLGISGFTHPLYTTSYTQWYAHLVYTCLKHILLQHIMHHD